MLFYILYIICIITYRKTPCLNTGDTEDKLRWSRRKGVPGARTRRAKVGGMWGFREQKEACGSVSPEEAEGRKLEGGPDWWCRASSVLLGAQASSCRGGPGRDSSARNEEETHWGGGWGRKPGGLPPLT